MDNEKQFTYKEQCQAFLNVWNVRNDDFKNAQKEVDKMIGHVNHYPYNNDSMSINKKTTLLNVLQNAKELIGELTAYNEEKIKHYYDALSNSNLSEKNYEKQFALMGLEFKITDQIAKNIQLNIHNTNADNIINNSHSINSLKKINNSIEEITEDVLKTNIQSLNEIFKDIELTNQSNESKSIFSKIIQMREKIFPAKKNNEQNKIK